MQLFWCFCVNFVKGRQINLSTMWTTHTKPHRALGFQAILAMGTMVCTSESISSTEGSQESPVILSKCKHAKLSAVSLEEFVGMNQIGTPAWLLRSVKAELPVSPCLSYEQSFLQKERMMNDKEFECCFPACRSTQWILWQVLMVIHFFLGHHALDRKFLEENFTFPDPSTPSLQDLDSAWFSYFLVISCARCLFNAFGLLWRRTLQPLHPSGPCRSLWVPFPYLPVLSSSLEGA